MSNFGLVRCHGAIIEVQRIRVSPPVTAVVAGKGFDLLNLLRVLLQLAHAGAVLMACRISPRAAKRRSILPYAQQEQVQAASSDKPFETAQTLTNMKVLEAWPSWPIEGRRPCVQ